MPPRGSSIVTAKGFERIRNLPPKLQAQRKSPRQLLGNGQRFLVFALRPILVTVGKQCVTDTAMSAAGPSSGANSLGGSAPQ